MTLVMLKILDKNFEIKYLPRKEMRELQSKFGTEFDYSEVILLSANYVGQRLITISDTVIAEEIEEYIYKEAIEVLYKMYFKGLLEDSLHGDNSVVKINVATSHEQNRIYNQIFN